MLPDDLRQTLRMIGVRPSKERGQNFLVDSNAIDQIIQFGRPQRGDNVLEIGPGLGVLTAELSEAVDKLTVVEIEEGFCRHLRRKIPEVTVVNQDFMTFDLSELGSDLVVFGNLPYSCSSAIIFHLIAHAACVQRAVFLLQKEFVARMVATPGGRTYGALSVACQYAAGVRPGPIIRAASFYPVPKVDSQIVELRLSERPQLEEVDPFWLQRTVQACFFKRRRKILNSVAASRIFADIDFSEALKRVGIDPERRAETLSLEEFGRLSCEVAASVHRADPQS